MTNGFKVMKYNHVSTTLYVRKVFTVFPHFVLMLQPFSKIVKFIVRLKILHTVFHNDKVKKMTRNSRQMY